MYFTKMGTEKSREENTCKSEFSQPVGFEPTRHFADNGLAGHRLNHSAKAAYHSMVNASC